MAFGFIGTSAGDAWAKKMVEKAKVAHQKRSDALSSGKASDDLIIELVEKHHGSGKAMQVADILKED